MDKLSVVRIFLSFLNGFYLPSSVVVIMFVVVRVVFDSPPEKITAIGITILEIITAEIQAIMIITTFPDKKTMVTDIMRCIRCISLLEWSLILLQKRLQQ